MRRLFLLLKVGLCISIEYLFSTSTRRYLGTWQENTILGKVTKIQLIVRLSDSGGRGSLIKLNYVCTFVTVSTIATAHAQTDSIPPYHKSEETTDVFYKYPPRQSSLGEQGSLITSLIFNHLRS
uniref:Secreted protein n=1 Tax=Lygus hesperus TaxID=30085 RepID=A0A146LWR0_LYGHE